MKLLFSVLNSEVKKLIQNNQSLQNGETIMSSYELASQIGLSSASKKI